MSRAPCLSRPGVLVTRAAALLDRNRPRPRPRQHRSEGAHAKGKSASKGRLSGPVMRSRDRATIRGSQLETRVLPGVARPPPLPPVRPRTAMPSPHAMACFTGVQRGGGGVISPVRWRMASTAAVRNPRQRGMSCAIAGRPRPCWQHAGVMFAVLPPERAAPNHSALPVWSMARLPMVRSWSPALPAGCALPR
jgi:hypothetical protein